MTPDTQTLAVRIPDMPRAGDHAIAGRATVPAVELLDVTICRLGHSP